jgi:hypothetical protein
MTIEPVPAVCIEVLNHRKKQVVLLLLPTENSGFRAEFCVFGDLFLRKH